MKDKKTKDVFSVIVLELDRSDIEGAICTLEEDVQEVLRGMIWDTNITKKIAAKLQRTFYPMYLDLLPSAIKEAIKDEIEEMNSKRNFLSGLRRYLKIGRKK